MPFLIKIINLLKNNGCLFNENHEICSKNSCFDEPLVKQALFHKDLPMFNGNFQKALKNSDRGVYAKICIGFLNHLVF